MDIRDVLPEQISSVGVVGSRNFENKEFAFERLDWLRWTWGDFAVVSGGAAGADSIGIEWAKDRGLKFEVHEAAWDDLGQPGAKIKTNRVGKQYNVLAGFQRNQIIVDKSSVIVAFWNGATPGTGDTISKAQHCGKVSVIFWPGRDTRFALPPNFYGK